MRNTVASIRPLASVDDHSAAMHALSGYSGLAMSMKPELSIRYCKLTCTDTYAHHDAPEEYPAVDVPGMCRNAIFGCGDAIGALKKPNRTGDDDHEFNAIE
jgi:hypothetical protein